MTLDNTQERSLQRRIAMWAVLMIVPAFLMIMVEYRSMGSFGHQTPDARVYISIADNFTTTGHFIQTDRAVDGLVVPPGCPLFLTVFRLLHFSDRMIIAMQILMFGLCNIMLYETERRITGKGGWAPVFYTMAYMRCWVGLGIFLAEHYYLFLLCLALWVVYQNFSEKKKVISLNIIGLLMMITRPLLTPVYLTILAYSLYWCFRNKKALAAAGLVLLPIVVLAVNMAVNYRETGEYILLENYSGSDMYTATRLNSPVRIEEAEEFMDETYIRICEDDSLTQSQRNAEFKALAKENLQDHFGLYLYNGLVRGHEIFLRAYAWTTLYTLLGGILLSRKERQRGNLRSTCVLILTLLLAAMSSFGVSEVRYSMVIWPMASLHGAYLTHLICRYLFRRRHPDKALTESGRN
jgi:hypothetical protein